MTIHKESHETRIHYVGHDVDDGARKDRIGDHLGQSVRLLLCIQVLRFMSRETQVEKETSTSGNSCYSVSGLVFFVSKTTLLLQYIINWIPFLLIHAIDSNKLV